MENKNETNIFQISTNDDMIYDDEGLLNAIAECEQFIQIKSTEINSLQNDLQELCQTQLSFSEKETAYGYEQKIRDLYNEIIVSQNDQIKKQLFAIETYKKIIEYQKKRITQSENQLNEHFHFLNTQKNHTEQILMQLEGKAASFNDMIDRVQTEFEKIPRDFTSHSSSSEFLSQTISDLTEFCASSDNEDTTYHTSSSFSENSFLSKLPSGRRFMKTVAHTMFEIQNRLSKVTSHINYVNNLLGLIDSHNSSIHRNHSEIFAISKQSKSEQNISTDFKLQQDQLIKFRNKYKKLRQLIKTIQKIVVSNEPNECRAQLMRIFQ